ncbi:serine protease inhibitor Kazal-type 2 [Antechinus flavipes]|uniref:serine protease inhibitor Kazal-type 2 n=1 Tax=Antechinus flavipes TaxID=38775 RepID=UPI00223550F9|nr:serine protease inhibitor Kazal-type 2 [Antechinus flavipes]
MKRFFVVVPLLVMLLTENFTVTSSYGDPDNPDDSSVIIPDCKAYGIPGCPRDLSPVCGTDSLTYANECTLCQKNREEGKDIKIKWRGRC